MRLIAAPLRGAIAALAIATGVMAPAAGQQRAQDPQDLVLAAGKADFAEVWLERDGSYFSSYMNPDTRANVIVQAKDLKFSSTFTPPLRADAENGQEGQGYVRVLADLVRRNEGGRGWERWYGPAVLYGRIFQRTGGRFEKTEHVLYMDSMTGSLQLPSVEQITALGNTMAPVEAPLNPDCPAWRKNEHKCE
jgi:hypothetical protein